ncbi:unnamed protein product [Nezara viridula]|uniref:Uncharacterized protein n=1 Tax=Nezara viridula TaxID=85310 RepID=A0A9P0MUM8_NEZVI|nr:unnamed protein product [Nezara viridula]
MNIRRWIRRRGGRRAAWRRGALMASTKRKFEYSSCNFQPSRIRAYCIHGPVFGACPIHRRALTYCLFL